MAKKAKTGCLGAIFDFSKIFLQALIIFFSIFCCITVLNNYFEDEPAALADGFEISSYNVVLDVKKNNMIEVTENITVNFISDYKHGIYKFTPEWLEYTPKDGKTIKRKSIVSDYRAIGDDYSVDEVKKKKRIKIGNAYEYVGAGEKEYVIKYNYDMGKDPFKKFDELIFHAYGDYWGTEIKNASIKVNMPKELKDYKINFFMDKYRKESANEFIDYTVTNNTIIAKFNEEKYYNSEKEEYCSLYNIEDDGCCNFPSWHNSSLRKSLTLDIELPEGYFEGGSWNYGYYSFIICIFIFLITIWDFIRWKKYGKDFPKYPTTVEFYPPENYSSAEVGYIYGGQANNKLTISLIVQLASKGYIKIDELENKEIQITNLFLKPKEQLSFDDLVPERAIKVRKLKDIDLAVLTSSERKNMEYLFKNSDEKVVTKKIDSFLEVKDSLVNKGLIEIVEDNESKRYDEFNNRKDEYEKSKKQFEIDMKKYDEELSKMPKLSSLELQIYTKLFDKKDVIILSKHKTFYKMFDVVDKELKENLKDLINDKTAAEKMIQSIFITILVFSLSLISYFYFEDMEPNYMFIYILAFACIGINTFLTIIMKRKTQYGKKIIAQIKGFREFLVTVEKEKLEALVSENPRYFYDILPYTYVLNISKKWIEKFENIYIPQENIGNYDFNNDNLFYDMYSNIYIPAPSTSTSSSSSSSGCSSCGGGSSGGGGCSSCGGGGSW